MGGLFSPLLIRRHSTLRRLFNLSKFAGKEGGQSAARPRSSVASSTLAFFKTMPDQISIICKVFVAQQRTLRWSGGALRFAHLPYLQISSLEGVSSRLSALPEMVYSVDETVCGTVAMEQLLQKPFISKSCEIVSGTNLVHDG